MDGAVPDVLPGDVTRVVVIDPDGFVDADEVLKMAREITQPDFEALFR
jgi:hypothetical protein